MHACRVRPAPTVILGDPWARGASAERLGVNMDRSALAPLGRSGSAGRAAGLQAPLVFRGEQNLKWSLGRLCGRPAYYNCHIA